LPADAKDHFPPKNRRFDFPIKRIMVRCCRPCNIFLRNTIQLNLEERKNRALMRFNKRINFINKKKRLKKLFRENFYKGGKKEKNHV